MESCHQIVRLHQEDVPIECFTKVNLSAAAELGVCITTADDDFSLDIITLNRG